MLCSLCLTHEELEYMYYLKYNTATFHSERKTFRYNKKRCRIYCTDLSKKVFKAATNGATVSTLLYLGNLYMKFADLTDKLPVLVSSTSLGCGFLFCFAFKLMTSDLQFEIT